MLPPPYWRYSVLQHYKCRSILAKCAWNATPEYPFCDLPRHKSFQIPHFVYHSFQINTSNMAAWSYDQFIEVALPHNWICALCANRMQLQMTYCAGGDLTSIMVVSRFGAVRMHWKSSFVTAADDIQIWVVSKVKDSRIVDKKFFSFLIVAAVWSCTCICVCRFCGSLNHWYWKLLACPWRESHLSSHFNTWKIHDFSGGSRIFLEGGWLWEPDNNWGGSGLTEFRLRNDLYCVEWGVKLYSLTHSLGLLNNFMHLWIRQARSYIGTRGSPRWMLCLPPKSLLQFFLHINFPPPVSLDAQM